MKRLALIFLLCLGTGAPASEPDSLSSEIIASMWGAWKSETDELRGQVRHLEERLQREGEAQWQRRPPSWWNIPSRQKQGGRLRYLQRLRQDLAEKRQRLKERLETEAGWRKELKKRKNLDAGQKKFLEELERNAEKGLADKAELD